MPAFFQNYFKKQIFKLFVTIQIGVIPVSIVQWHAEIGVFNARFDAKHLKLKYHRSICFLGSCHLYVMGCLFLLLLICADGIKINTCPKKEILVNFSLCNRNLNNIAAYNFLKLTLLEAYNMNHNFNIICLPETYLDSYIQHDDERLHLNGYKLATTDNPDYNKRGGGGIYFKDFLEYCFRRLYPK